jgi:hypothetical protein
MQASHSLQCFTRLACTSCKQKENCNAFVSNARGLVWGSRFPSSYEVPNYSGPVILASFGWDDKPRSSVCTHSEHQALAIKILQSLCVSHKIVETYRNLQRAPKFSKSKWEGCANGSTDQSHLRMWHLLRTGQAPKSPPPVYYEAR